MVRKADSKRTARGDSRSGVTLLECAITLPVMFVALFGMLDLGIAAARYNALAEAARRIAREAVIHGSLAPQESTKWGPTEYVGTGADNSDIAKIARPVFLAMPSQKVSIRVSWPDANNSPHDRVRVEVSYRHEPLIPQLFVWGPIDLRAVSTMCIVN
jgi:Flp pilus assembly protein TadG